MMPDEVPVVGPARVVLLEPGQRWTYRSPKGHDVA